MMQPDLRVWSRLTLRAADDARDPISQTAQTLGHQLARCDPAERLWLLVHAILQSRSGAVAAPVLLIKMAVSMATALKPEQRQLIAGELLQAFAQCSASMKEKV